MITRQQVRTSRTRLAPEQLDDYRADGFVVLRELFDRTLMRQLSVWTEEVVAFDERPGRHMVYYEDSLAEPGQRVLSRIEDFCPYHAQLDAVLNGAEVLALVSTLLGEPAVMFKDKINFKMPGADGFKAHQDVQAGWDRYAALHLTLLLSIDSATPDNGCLELVAGAHDRGLLGESWKPLDDSGEQFNYVACPTEPGDAVLFDSFVPHRSAPNLTSQPRRILYVTYNALSAGDHRRQYYADKRRSYPPDIERDATKAYVYRV